MPVVIFLLIIDFIVATLILVTGYKNKDPVQLLCSGFMFGASFAVLLYSLAAL